MKGVNPGVLPRHRFSRDRQDLFVLEGFTDGLACDATIGHYLLPTF